MNAAIKFGTSGWRAIIADEFTFGNVRRAVAAIADHVLSRNPKPTLLIGHDTRFFSEEFSLYCGGRSPAARRGNAAVRRGGAYACHRV